MSRSCSPVLLCLAIFVLGWAEPARADEAEAKAALKQIGVQRGICVLLGDRAALSIPLARQSELTLFVQSASASDVADLRRKADAAGLLGTRIYVQQGDLSKLHLASDLADAVLVGKDAKIPKEEVLRVLRTEGKALGAMELVKPVAPGTDEWTHPYHGPDNNPQSLDRVARRPFMTHFLAEPWYCPLTQMTVASGGRLFKAFGDRSSAKPQEALLGKLLAMSAYNGTILWMRELSPGFLIHRNTMIATPQTLFLGDDKSCQLIDAATGKVRDEIVVPEGISDGPVWKWLALENNILYGLVGEKEPLEITARGDRIRGAGWPWWKYPDYKYGFGRTLLAIDPATKKILWHQREKEQIDGRGVCLRNGRLYYFAPPSKDGKESGFLACLEAKTGKQLWKNSDRDLLEAIGPHGAAQHPMLGFASTAYMKVGDEAIFFAGPQRPRLVGASTKDGKLLWQHAGGNVQLVLREDGLFALGEGRINEKKSSLKLDPLTGKILASFPSRDRCTRATGCFDSIFTRGGAGGSTAVFDVTGSEPKMGVLSPMRPACTDGVVVANGYLYWGPWMCACDQTQIGVLSLGPAGKQLGKRDPGGHEGIKPRRRFAEIESSEGDWPTYRHDNACSAVSKQTIPAAVERKWEYRPRQQTIATAPTAVGGLVFVSGSDGVVRAVNGKSGKQEWTAYTGGPIKYPPVIWESFAYVGSGDGWVYCFVAATGEQVWRYRVAPQERIMPVHGTLTSTWPVGSGVLVNKGVVYAAAGIFNYDGTHVYALDASTGKVRWQNSTSGSSATGDLPDAGVSVQGHLLLHGDKVWMPAGNRPTVASYALADGKFAGGGQGRGKHLFVRNQQVKATGFPLYWRTEDDHFLSPMELETPAGPLAISTGKVGRFDANAGPKDKAAWTNDPYQEIAGVAVGKNAVVIAGVNRNKKGDVTEKGLTAVSLVDGKVLWREELPATPVAWGVAIDRDARIVVSMLDGRVVAFGAK